MSPDAADLGVSDDLLALVAASQAAIAAAEKAKEEARLRELRLERRARWRLRWIVGILSVLMAVGTARLAYLEFLRQSARAAGVTLVVPGIGVAFERYEVTNERYQHCVDAGACAVPTPQISTYFQQDAEDRPASGVDAIQAAAFCHWIGRRLPTSDEWHYAATQGGRTPWPWGAQEPSLERATLLYDATTPETQLQPSTIGHHLQGATPEGIEDLIGNVQEWTATPKAEAAGRQPAPWNGQAADVPARLVVVGGDYQTSPGGIAQVNDQIGFRAAYLGFRCVESSKP
jgi:formylglycine-generating enzyme required for sulfatase activity